MKYFKKRTLALILASMITVLGTFAAQGYGNSLMALDIHSENNTMGINLLTKYKLDTGIDIIRKDEYTYNIILSDTKSDVMSDYSLNEDIESFEILTMPYTRTMKGYTKIIVTLNRSMPLKVSTGLYIESKQENKNSIATKQQDRSYSNTIHSRSGVDQIGTVDINESVKQFSTEESTKSNVVDFDNKNVNETKNDILYVLLGLCLVVSISIFLMLKAKEKIKDLTGESSVIDTNVEPMKEQVLGKAKSKSSQIKHTISNLDKRYTHDIIQPRPFIQDNVHEEEIQPNIVDLDELLQEKQFNSNTANNDSDIVEEDDDEAVTVINSDVSNLSNSDESNQEEQNWDLEDFLNMCDLEEIEDEPEIDTENELKVNEELYEKIISSDNLSFVNNDIEKIQALLDIEIDESTKQYAREHISPVKKITKTSKEILEDFMTTYVAKQNIVFTKEDVQALYKIINVEIDNDFITDLKTNPSRMKEMQDEIIKQKAKPHNTSEVLTLNVKNMLPDLSEALRQQGNKKIESNAPPQVVYYSEGYNVDTLSVDGLPNLATEVNNEDLYHYVKPEEVKLVDNSYSVGTLSISSELPNLEEMLQHPEKYQQSEPTIKQADEKQLLDNIQNVSFKPFFDETRQIEVINDIPEDDDVSLTVSDVQNEFNQFDQNFKIINEEPINDVETTSNDDNDDFVSLFDNNYVDLDKQEDLVLNNDIKESNGNKYEDEAKILIDKINQQSQRNKFNRRTINRVINHQKEVKDQENIVKPNFCVIDDERFSILNVTNFNEKQGCYLAKNDSKYCIIGFNNDKIFKIKNYDTLSSERLQSRVNAKLEDGIIQYLIRVGKNKFVMNISENKMEFVMDLC